VTAPGSLVPVADAASSRLPLVVQLAFAGSRTLFDAAKNPEIREETFHDAVHQALVERLQRLASELGLGGSHFFCGLSQLAIGADTIFTRSLQTLGWPQRLLLPQNREDFLSAAGANGAPDFNAQARDAARHLFDSQHVIQELVVSDSPDRHTRFQDVNRELLRLGDLMVCLVGADRNQAGGTREVIEDARRHERPVLELAVDVGDEGQLVFSEQWHHRDRFVVPRLPHELDDLDARSATSAGMADYCQALKQFASRLSKRRRDVFRVAALVIIGTHLAATGLAVVALQQRDSRLLRLLIAGELLLLGTGFAIHHGLHRMHVIRTWALARLVAEIARSALALQQVSGYLRHFFILPFPSSLRPLLRTLNVLHLRETHRKAQTWPACRDAYVSRRLQDSQSGQIPYFERSANRAALWLNLGRRAFLASSAVAILATATELLLALDYLHLPIEHDVASGVLGTLAIVMPVAAVGALSLTASFDLEGRVDTYRAMRDLLKRQEQHLNSATSERDFYSLAIETEMQLLGETVGWFTRRSFTGIN
jgi:uncharacterized membrane protein YqjE